MIDYFHEKAAQCRRLAANLSGDLTARALLKLADEFEVKAALYEAEKRAALAIEEATPVELRPAHNLQ